MAVKLVTPVIYAMVGITADGTEVPIQHDPDVGYYSRDVAFLNDAHAACAMPRTSQSDLLFAEYVASFKPNETYFPGVVRLELREYRFT